MMLRLLKQAGWEVFNLVKNLPVDVCWGPSSKVAAVSIMPMYMVATQTPENQVKVKHSQGQKKLIDKWELGRARPP